MKNLLAGLLVSSGKTEGVELDGTGKLGIWLR